jgi:hypothetical protein
VILKDSTDRVKNEQAYGVLVTKVKKADKDVDRDTFIKNNNIFMALDFFSLPITIAIVT